MTYYVVKDLYHHLEDKKLDLVQMGVRLAFVASIVSDRRHFMVTEGGGPVEDSAWNEKIAAVLKLGAGAPSWESFFRNKEVNADSLAVGDGERHKDARATPWSVSYSPLYFAIIDAELYAIGRLVAPGGQPK
jgi:hypothetical protein